MSDNNTQIANNGSDLDLPGYDTIFGKLDFKKGDEARSVYSPAAYLVDLLQIMHDEFDAANPVNDSFEQRRDDIGKIILDAENTFGIIPYLDIVNEILEKQVGSNPYTTLKNSTFPMNLPFDLENERIKLCLKHMGVTAEQFYKLFAVQQVKSIIAREYLGLSPEELQVILGQDSATLLAKYGNPASMSDLAVVETFLEHTKISGRELRELLFQNLSQEELGKEEVDGQRYYQQQTFFVNDGLNGYATFDADEENLTWNTGAAIPDAWFERAHRLIRFSKKTGLSLNDLDIMLRDCCANQLDDNAILKIAVIKNMADSYDVPIDEVCGLFKSVNTMGHGSEEEPADLFDRLFNGHHARFTKQYIPGSVPGPAQYEDSEFTELTYTGDILGVDNKNFRSRIHCTLGIPEKEQTRIVKTFRLKETDETLWSDPGNQLKTLSLFFRLNKLVDLLDTSYEELFHIFDVLEKDPVIHQFNHFDTLLHFPTSEQDCYKIIAGDDIEAAMWLVQTTAKLIQWMQANDFTGEELKKIVTGDYTEKIQLTEIEADAKEEKTEEEKDREEKIRFLDDFYQGYKPLFFGEDLFVSNRFDGRAARIIHESVLAGDKLVSKTDNRLLFYREEQAREAAYGAIDRFDTITRDDFLGLGIEEKIADKIFKNLVWKGYLNTDGTLNEEVFAEAGEENFSIDTDFSTYKEDLFNIIYELHAKHGDVSIYPSDLKALNLTEAQADELYDNLVLNGYLDEKGALLQPVVFEDKKYISNFEVNAHIGEYSDIGAYTADVFNRVAEQKKRFETCEITLDKEIFEMLPLDESVIDDLVENLRFNEYIDEDNLFIENQKLLDLDVKNFSLALQFYPHRRVILKAIKDYIDSYREGYYTVKKALFAEIADNIIADWCYMAVERVFLTDGRLEDEQKEFFKKQENTAEFDVWWSFDKNDNAIVFNRIRGIVLDSETYKFTYEPLKEWNFNDEEVEEITGLLIRDGYLDEENKIPRDKLDYFLNADNALVFTIEAYEDYNRDVFFLLHTIAKEVDGAAAAIIDAVEKLAVHQELYLYRLLQDGFGLHADSLRAISAVVFKGADNSVEEWLLPILAAVDEHDKISAEPENYKFNAAYKRIKQFALLTSKLKLSKEEIDIAFLDQDLVERFPENLILPNGVTTFDALMQAEDGVYLFKDNRCWLYDPHTYEIVEKEDGTDRVLTDVTELLKRVANVDAAFVDIKGNQVIIAAGLYLIKEKPGKEDEETIWQVKQEHRWGKIENIFDDLERIDAALTDREGRAYLFSGAQYVRYSGDNYDNVDQGYPKEIAENWKNEEITAVLPQTFRETIDGAFHGTDNKTYLFKGDHFFCSDNMTEPQPVNSKWGHIKNNFTDLEKIDAAYDDGGQYFIFSGDQVIAYRDCLENEGVLVEEGFPGKIADHFPNIPPEFHQDIEAAFKGTDNKIYLFKEGKYVGFTAADTTVTALDVRGLVSGWGKVTNDLADNGAVDTAFTGLDGKTYLFSGTQYFRYSGDDYSRVDPGYPRKVADDWSQLISIDAAFVMDGKTYIFGKDPANKAMYIRYSTNDYTRPDEDYPKEQNDNWWNFPFSLTGHEITTPGFDKVDAVFNTMDGKTYLFSGDKFIYFDHMHRWWSEPQAFGEKWDNIPFASIDAAFTGKDGRTYLFSGSEYARFSGPNFTQIDKGYPRTTGKFWGNVKNNIAETGIVDAAVVVLSHVEEEKAAGDQTIVEKHDYLHTYLFSGDQYVRYLDTDYSRVESGYPRMIAESLKEEPRFGNMESEKVTAVQAAFADQRNIYLFDGKNLQVCSDEPDKKYEAADLPQSGCVVMEDGALFSEVGNTWNRFSSLEGKSVVRTPQEPRWVLDASAQYKTGVNAVLQGTDGNTYIFKGPNVFDLMLENTVPIKQEWGLGRNNIRTGNSVDAAFIGRDGKTYLFSGDQFVNYEGVTCLDAETEKAPKLISEHWGGLASVAVAYVFDGKTYLFEKPQTSARTPGGNFRVLRYSGDNYETPDEGYPLTVDFGFWNIPGKYIEEGFEGVDAVLVDGKEMLFIYGDQFLEYNREEDYWSHPKSIDTRWDGLTCTCTGHDAFEHITTAFKSSDGTVYFFWDESFAAVTNGSFSPPARTGDHWGIAPNILKDKVDAAFVHRGVTYLFSGEKYIRYSGSDYRVMDDEYPKTIVNNLRTEEGFANLPEDFEVRVNALAALNMPVIVNAVAANAGNIYIRVNDNRTGSKIAWYAISGRLTRNYHIRMLGAVRNNLVDGNAIDAAFVNSGKTYLFAGEQYIRYTGDRYEYIDAGYPKKIASNLTLEDDLGTVPAHFDKGVDAAFKGSDGNIYLFKDLKYYNSGNAAAGAVDIKGAWGTIANNFTAVPDDNTIDAAFIDPMGRLYAFKGSQFIRYTDLEQEYVDPEFPKPVKDNWGNLPDEFETGIDGAFNFEGNTYFIDGDKYIKYSHGKYDTFPGIYPRTFADWWGDRADYHLGDIKIITRFKELQDSYGSDYTLVDLLHKGTGYVKSPHDILADIFNFDVEEVKWLKRHNAFLMADNPYESRFHLEEVIKIFNTLNISRKMGGGIAGIYYDAWKKCFDTPADLAAAADALHAMLGTTGCRGSNFDVLLDEIHDALNLLKRDAVVPYVIANDAGTGTARGLYEKLLIDVQMGSCGKTSRIKEALSAVQLFFHRYFINLEEVDLKGTEDEERWQTLKERWKWMRNYRVWEANRKVFLYPENYIRPELRDTITPAFKTLEEELSQGEITTGSAARAYKKYLDEYTEVSRLKIAGGYVYAVPGADAGTNKLVLFGRTKTDPRRYYYRTAEFLPGGGASTIWEPWLKCEVKIDSDRVYPVFAFNKVFVFWAQTIVKNDDSAESNIKFKSSGDDYNVDAPKRTLYQIKIYFSFYNLNKEWLPAQVLKDQSQNEVVITCNTPIKGVKLYVETSNKLDAGDSDSQDHENIVISCTYKTDVWTVTWNSNPPVPSFPFPPIPPAPFTAGWVTHDLSRSYRLTPELYSQPTTKPNFDPNGQAVVNALLQESPPLGEDAIVMFNGSEDSSDGPWFSFDHKGGSFLCKPESKPIEPDAWPRTLMSNSDNFPQWNHIDAAFCHNGKSWFFNNETKKYVTSANIGIEIDIHQDWGKVYAPSAIIDQIDSAINDGEKTYLFAGNKYYRHTIYDTIDDEQEQELKGNPDGFPEWNKIDAAFKGKDGKKYFFNNAIGKFISSDSNVEKDIKDHWGIIQNAFSDPADTTPVIAALLVDNKSYIVKENQFIRITGTTYDVVDTGYPRQGKLDALLTDIGFTDIPTALQGKTLKVIRVDGDDVYAGTSDGIYRKGTKSGTTTTWTTLLKENFPKTIFETDSKIFSKEIDSTTQLTYQDKTGGPVKTFSFNKQSVPQVIDAIFVAEDDTAYIFSGQEYMASDKNLFNGNSIAWSTTGYIYEDWGKISTNIAADNSIDAALVIGDHTYLFSGDEYYRYTGAEYDFVDNGYPKKINTNTDNFPTWDHMDAALNGSDETIYFFDRGDGTYVTGGDLATKLAIHDKFGAYQRVFYEKVEATYINNGKLYVASGDQFFRYTYNSSGDKWNMDPGYPKTMSLPGLTTVKLDAAFTMGNTSYLFSGDRYYKLGAGEEPDSITTYYFIQGNWSNIPHELRSGIDAALKTDSELYLFKNMNSTPGRVDYIKYSGLDTPEGAAPGEVRDSLYDIIRLTSSTAYKLNQQLFSGGVEALLRLWTQEIDELPGFTETGGSLPTVIKVRPNKVTALPVSTHLDFNSANGIYYWEIFFHAPFLIAQALNTDQKFDEAKEWYEYVFDPTEPGTYWKFLPFLAVDIDAVIRGVENNMDRIKEIGTTPALPSFDNLAAALREYKDVFMGRRELNDAEVAGLEAMPASSVMTTFENGIASAENSAAEAQKPFFTALYEIIAVIKRMPYRYQLMLTNPAQVKTYLDDPFDPHAIAALRRIAYRRAIVMAYVDNLIDWGDMLFTRYTVESINEARMLYILAYDLLGKKPENVGNKILPDALDYEHLETQGAEQDSNNAYDFLFDLGTGVGSDEAGQVDRSLTYAGTIHDTVANAYFYIPENSLLLDYWGRVEDRLYKIRHCLNIMGISQPLPLFQPPIDPMALVNAAAGGGGLGAALAQMSAPVPHYRFTFMLNKAREMASKLNQFGGDLLAAIEKKDAEELSLLQNKQELSILKLTEKIREAQLNESKENLKNLEAMKKSAEMQKTTYESWMGMLTAEKVQIGMMITAAAMHIAVPILKLGSAIASVIPDIKVGSPFSMGATTGGSTIGAALGFAAEAVESISEAVSMGGEVAGIYAQYIRSENDWKLQRDMAIEEAKQLAIQIEGAKYQIEAAQLEVLSTQKEIENNEAMTTFMKEKFSNQQLYQWMTGKLSGMFFQTYKIAHDMARAAERAFIFERGIKESDVNYIGGAYWDSMKKGLLAGEELGLDLDRMEKAFIETDARGFEITKLVSLVEIDPLAFLQLKDKGVCEFDLTEALYDYDFQGHYNRQIKTLSLILDAGEGVTVNATLTQLRNKTVMEPDVKAVKYLLNPKDAQPLTIRSDWRSSQQIVLSHVGEYDENNGMFELRLDDERYLPFEGTGAVSSWRLELNGKKGSFDIDNLKDVAIKIKYTADQGGEGFAASVKGLLKPYPTAVLINMAEQFPNDWYAFIHGDTDDLQIPVTRDMFPNMSGSKILGLYSAYRYNEQGQATLKLNDEIDLKHNKMLPSPGLTIGSKGETWTFTAKGNKRALENMVIALTYKASVE